MRLLDPKELLLPPAVSTLIAELDAFNARWTATRALAPDRLASLRQVATIESVGSSTRIEGAKLSNAQIEALLRGVKTFSFRSRDEQEVAGYAEAMETVFSSHADIPLTENHIRQLHGILLKFSSKDERRRGNYKKFPNAVEAFDPKGKSLGIIFRTATPLDTPGFMKALVDWTNERIESKDLHPLLIVALFVVTFFQVHPFQDGNGRLSRTLTTLLLLRFGYAYVPYSSMERVIEENKEAYYLALRRAQVELDRTDMKKKAPRPESGEGMRGWILFFLRAMQKQKMTHERKLSEELVLIKLPTLSLQILELIKNHGPTSISEVVAGTRANRNTIKLHLRQLVETDYLVADGRGRGVRYRVR